MKFWDRVTKEWQAMWTKIGKLFPPGYDYRAEVNSSWILIGLGLFMTLNFYERLHSAYHAVHIYRPGIGRVIWEGAIARPFTEVSKGYFLWFLPWLVFQLLSMVLHYMYYYQKTKSIYVMRRIASVGPMVKSCVSGTMFQLTAGAAVIVFVYFVLFGIYLCVMPGVCNPGFW